MVQVWTRRFSSHHNKGFFKELRLQPKEQINGHEAYPVVGMRDNWPPVQPPILIRSQDCWCACCVMCRRPRPQPRTNRLFGISRRSRSKKPLTAGPSLVLTRVSRFRLSSRNRALRLRTTNFRNPRRLRHSLCWRRRSGRFLKNRHRLAALCGSDGRRQIPTICQQFIPTKGRKVDHEVSRNRRPRLHRPEGRA
jgi:hypothetical protein